MSFLSQHYIFERLAMNAKANAHQAIPSMNLPLLHSDLSLYVVSFTTNDLTFAKPKDNGEKFTSLLIAIIAYDEEFSADSIIHRNPIAMIFQINFEQFKSCMPL